MPPAARLADVPVHLLIPAAGIGQRAGAHGPKQYRLLAGRPMLWHTLRAFAALDGIALRLVVIAPGTQLPDGLRAGWPQNVQVADCGGATRAASVRAGLTALRERGAADSDWVLVHDAARCLVPAQAVARLMQACAADAVGGLLALPLADTLKQAAPVADAVVPEAAPRVAATLPREGKWLAQTPQMFRLGPLAAALDAVGDAATDEASAIEAMGARPLLVAGSALNFKLTWPEDFALAEAILQSGAGT